MDDDFNDVLSIFSDEPEKEEKPEAAAEKDVEAASPAAPAPAAGTFKKPVPGKGLQRPMPGGKFSRPAAPVTPATPSAPQPPPSAPQPPPSATQRPLVQTPAAALPVLTPAPKAGGSVSTVLLVLLILFSLVSLIISASALTKVSAMRTEMKMLNENMNAVRTSADRSWQIKCGIFSPVPNQRPQEYMIMYEEKNGKLVRKETIIKPVE